MALCLGLLSIIEHGMCFIYKSIITNNGCSIFRNHSFIWISTNHATNMKKVIITVLGAVCLCMAIPTQAQLKWGVKGGLNVSKLSIDSKWYSSDNQMGFFIGPMMEFNIPATGLGIDASVLYSQQAIRVNSNDREDVTEGNVQGLDVPINLKYTFGLGSMAGIYVAAGPDLFFDFSKKGELSYAYLIKKDMNIGLNVGAGIKLIKHLQIGVTYTIPLSDSGHLDDSAITDYFVNPPPVYKCKTTSWKVSAAYLF